MVTHHGTYGTRIAILHRDGLYRDSLSQCLAQAEPILIVYSSSRCDEPMSALFIAKPDLLIMEFGLCQAKEPGGAETRCACSDMGKTIVIGVPNREEDILACIERDGAAGYLLMDATVEDLLVNIRAVMKGETLCSPRIASLAFDRISQLARHAEVPRTDDQSRLTRREMEIVRLIDQGLSNKEIAVRLSIVLSTVKNHVHHILEKLQLDGRREAARYAKEHRLALSLH